MTVSWLHHLRNRGTLVCLTALTGSVLIVFGLVGIVAFLIGGTIGVAAAGVAAGVCLAGASAALIITRTLQGPNLALVALLAAMMTRMAIPLGFGLAIHLQGGPLANVGLLYYLLVFYLVTLSLEIVLSLPPADAPKA